MGPRAERADLDGVERYRPGRLLVRVGGIALGAALAALALVPTSAAAVRPPSHVRVVSATESSISYAWSGARSARFVTFRNGVRTGSTTRRTRTYGGLFCGTSYRLGVASHTRRGQSRRRVVVASTAPCPPPVFEGSGDLFVAPGGSNSSPCTQAAPCRSFDRAYQLAAPGDVVEVAGGRYRSQIFGPKPGTAAPDVRIVASAGQRVVVGDLGAEDGCLGFEGATYVSVDGVETSYTRVAGRLHQCGVSVGREHSHHVTLKDVDAGMIWVGADDVTVLGGDFGPAIDENTKIEWGSGHAPRNILIDGAVIHDARMVRQHQECLALWGGLDVTVRNTHFYNCAVFHVWINGSAGDVLENITLEGNLFTQPGPNPPPISSTIKVGDHGETLKNVVIRGNAVLADDIYVPIGYGGGKGDVHLFDNEVIEGISLGGGQSCMRDAAYTPKPGVLYECGGNRLVGG
jgi:hypothetical protein